MDIIYHISGYCEVLLYFAMNNGMNGFSTGEDDSRGSHDQICCLVENGRRCMKPAGNASYSKRIQKTVQQRKLKLNIDQNVSGTFNIICPMTNYKSIIEKSSSSNSNNLFEQKKYNLYGSGDCECS